MTVFGLSQEEIDRFLKEDEEEDRKLWQEVFPAAFATMLLHAEDGPDEQ